MYVRCDLMSQHQLALAEQYGICPKPGGVRPYNTVSGACGYSSLYMTDSGGGTARFLETAQINPYWLWGPIDFGTRTVSWTNWSLGTHGSVGGGIGPVGTYWAAYDYSATNSGYVTASMGGWVFVVSPYFGPTVCYFNSPSDGGTIT